jgi:nicotinate-nucleotide--dimethylbenzimidazole phosphoribosyltransferase
VARGVSAFPAEVTAQMVANFTNGGAAISQMAALHGLNLRVFELALELPTGDITIESAMDDQTCAATIAYGMEAIAGQPDLLAIGEMGIGNTTVAAAILAAAAPTGLAAAPASTTRAWDGRQLRSMRRWPSTAGR